MAPGLGIDLIEIDRIERALERRPRLAERLFTGAELEYAAGRARPGRHLAVRFAAKEAVVKALGLGPGTVLRDIEVLAGSPPELKAHGRVARELRSRNLEVTISLTHSRDNAAAVAIAGPGSPEPER